VLKNIIRQNVSSFYQDIQISKMEVKSKLVVHFEVVGYRVSKKIQASQVLGSVVASVTRIEMVG
jgi:hypothetical protein